MALTGNYKDIYFVMDRLHQNYGFDEITLPDVAEYIWDIMGYIGNPDTLAKKYAEVTITDFQGTLPADFYSLDQGAVVEKDTYIPLTSNLDELSLFGNNSSTEDPNTDLYTYKIINGYIYCGTEDTTLLLHYKAFPIDSNGLPLIPDNPKAIRLVVDFIAEKLAMKFYLRDKLTLQKFDVINKEALYSRAAFRNAALVMDMNTMERFKNRSLTILTHPDMYDNNFKNMGSKIVTSNAAYGDATDSMIITTTTIGLFSMTLIGTGTVTINWGDYSTIESVPLAGFASVIVTHTFAAPSTITISNASFVTSVTV